MRNLILLLGDCWHNFWVVLRNLRVSLSRRPLDFVYLDLFGELPEYTPALPFWRRFISIPFIAEEPRGPTMASVRYALGLLAGDPKPQGVIVRLDGLEIGWATAQSLRQIFQRFRESGKRIFVYADDYDTLKYYIATAADGILASPVAGWNVIGLRIETIFIAEALKTLDLEAEVITISPYKNSGDPLTHTDLSPESRENLEGLLDAHFAEIVQSISEARDLPPDQVQALIDQAPLPVAQALEAGLFDASLYQDEMDAFLRQQGASQTPSIVPLSAAWNRLRRPVEWRSGKLIGVISFEGVLMTGASRRSPVPIPFVGSRRVGQEDVVSALRRAERDKSLAAIVIYVDSRGGSALASDLVWREISRLRDAKPVVVYMNEIAASAAYYISVGASWIVSQPLTLTGSIGVLFIRMVTDGLFSRLKVNRVSLQRGAHAGIYADDKKLEPGEHDLIREHVFDLFDRFNDRVSTGRRLESTSLDEIGQGRVWLGKQAVERNLVDQMGDFEDALQKARELAGLSGDRKTPHTWIFSRGGSLLPLPARLAPAEILGLLVGMDSEAFWMISPLDIRIR